MKKELTVLLTGSGGPLGVNLTRSLLKSKSKFKLIGTEANKYHVPLSLTHQTFLIPYANRNTEEYIETLNKLVNRFDIDFIFPSHPTEVRTIAANRERFKGTNLFLPPLKVIKTGQNKWETYKLWKKAGLPVPETVLIENKDDAYKVFSQFESKSVWVRGAGVPGKGIGVASLPAKSPEQLIMWVDYWDGWKRMIASEFLPARNLTWLSVWNRGQLIASQSRERLEYVIPHVSPSGITGAPAVSRTIIEPKLNEIGEAAVKAIDKSPHGIFFIDLTEKTPGDPRMTEINAGRFGTTIHFYTEAGFNFPELAVNIGCNQPVSFSYPARDVIEPGLYWIRTLDCGPVLLNEQQIGKISFDNSDLSFL